MGSKIYNFQKTILILSSGIVLIMGVEHIKSSEVKKLATKLGNVRFEYDDFDNDTVLNDVYSELVYQIDDASSIYKKYIEKKYTYKVHSYIPTLSNDFVSYTFYDDYIEIDLLDKGEVYSSCYCNDDGSYYIVYNCKNDLDDRIYTVTYNFSKDGVLTDSSIYDGFFRSTTDCIDNDSYLLVKTK